jgi:hypothetical protein
VIESLVELATLVAVLGVAAMLAVNAIYARGRLRGAKEAMRELACGVASSYQTHGSPAPEAVKRNLDAMQQEVARARGEAKKAGTIVRALRSLGREMGTAARQTGYECGHKDGVTPLNNEIRIDLSLRDLLTIRWLAHAGFRLMMRNEAGDKFSFLDETDAQESNFALDRLEWRLSQEHMDPTAPHALALSRQQTIWQRWPEGNAAASPARKAA